MDNIEICRAYMHAFDTGDLDTLRAVHAPDFVWHHLAPRPGRDTGLDFLLQGAAMAKKSFRDFEHRIEAIYGLGDIVVMRTNGGGRPIDKPDAEILYTPAITIHRLANGRIQETWALPDMVGYLLNHNAIELSPYARKLVGLE